LFITVGAEGFLLSLFFPFRPGSPPLFIPWSRVESVTEQPAWFVDRAVIRIRGLPTKISIVGRAGLRISQAYARFAAGRDRRLDNGPERRGGDRQIGYGSRPTSA